MTSDPPVLVLDSFALLAFFRAEAAGPSVRDLLERASRKQVRLMMTVVNLAEVIYRTIRGYGLERAQEVLARIDAYAIEIVDINRDLALAAARLKGMYKVSYADCVAGALSQRLQAPVVTGDPDFSRLESVVTIEWLKQ